MKKILILSYYFPPLGMGGTQRIASFVKHLPSFGWQPTVVTVKDVAYHAYDQQLLRSLGQARIERTDSFDPLRLAAKLRRQPATDRSLSGHTSFARKVVNFFLLPDNKILWNPFLMQCAKALLQQEPFDAILSTGPPHSTHLAARKLARQFGIKWIADFRDSWAGGDFQAKSTSAHTAIDTALQKRVLLAADAIIAVSAGLAADLARSTKDVDDKISVITNGFEPDDFPEAPAQQNACFHVAHIGTTGNFVQPAIALRAFRVFIEDAGLAPNAARLTFVGADLDGTLPAQIAEAGLHDYCEVTGYQAHEQAVKFLHKADVLLFLTSGNPGKGFIPGKTFEYLAARKPVLALSEPIEGLYLLQKTGLVRHALPDDVPAAVNALKALFIEKEKGIESVRNDFDIQVYTRYNLTKSLVELLDLLIEKKSM